jgi:hypothetical protein
MPVTLPSISPAHAPRLKAATTMINTTARHFICEILLFALPVAISDYC